MKYSYLTVNRSPFSKVESFQIVADLNLKLLDINRKVFILILNKS